VGEIVMEREDVREKEVYSVLLTAEALVEQPSSMRDITTPVADGPLLVVVAEAVRAARLEAALLARWDSMPVAAARPITAADRSATMHERMKTSRLQPQIVRTAIDLVSGWVAAGWAGGL
jgi:hypothetical protein